MSALHIGTNVRRFFHGVIPPLAFIVISILPLLFGGLFVWSYYDPLGNLNKVPVALVNSDSGEVGSTVTEKLVDADVMDFHVVSASEARSGIADGTYYLGVEIPAGFSDTVTGLKDQATINVTLNNANGFIASMLGNQVTTVMASTVSDTVSEQVLDKLLVGFSDATDGAGQLADGAGKLKGGAEKAQDGATTLNEKLGEAANGAQTLANGAAELDSGAQRLRDGATQLDGGLGTAVEGATKLRDGLNTLQGATVQMGDGAGRLAGGVDKLTGPIAGIPEVGELRDGAHQLAYQLGDVNSPYRSGMSQAVGGANQLVDGLARLKDGSGTLVAGTATLSDGTQRLVVGSRQLADGTSQLAAGSDQLVVGLNDLADGAVRLDEGAGTLSLKLSDAKLPAAGVAAKPVEKQSVGDTLTTFGMGLSPFFLSLSLWLGALILYMVFAPLNRRAVDSGASPLRAALTVVVPGLIMSFIQATCLWLVQVFALGVPVTSSWGFYGALVGIGFAFNMLVLAIYAFFGATVGRLIAMALMTLQLVSSNGLYPPEVQPAFIQWVHGWDPMRYSVDLLRHVMVGSFDGDPRPGVAAVVLACCFVGGLGVVVLSNWRERVMMRKDLHPELAL